MKRTALVILGTALLIIAFMQCESPAVKGAKIYMDKGQTEQAKEQLLKALENEPLNPEVHFMLGKVYKEEKNFEKMNEHFELCLANSPKPAQVLDIEMERNRSFNQFFNDAARTMNAAIEQTDSDKRNSMLKESIDYLETAVMIVEDKRGYEAMGTAYFNMGDTKNAEAKFLKALELDPQMHNSLFQLGILKYNEAISGNKEAFKDAQKYLEKFVEYYPEEKANAFELGFCYAQNGEVDKAIAFFEEVIQENPDNVDGLIQYGVVLFENDQKTRAAEIFQRALALDPENLQVLKNIAFPLFYDTFNKSREEGVTVEKSEWENVLPYVKKVTELEPGNADAWEAIAVVYISLEMKDEAEAALAKAEELRK